MLIFDKERQRYQIINYKQFDTEKPLKAQFLDDGQPISLSDYNIRFECKKKDNTIVITDENLTVKNICEIEFFLNEQVTVVDGIAECQFVLVRKDNKKQNTTFTFELNIEKSVIVGGENSRSTITIAEKLGEDVLKADVLHKTLANDITEGNKIKEELVSKTNIANTTINTLVDKTNQGKTTIANLEQKITQGSNIDITLKQTINTANTTNQTAIKTNDKLLEDIKKAESLTNYLGSAYEGGMIKTIDKSEWAFKDEFYEYTINHNLDCEGIVINIIDIDLKEPLMPIVVFDDKDNLTIKSDKERNLKVVINASGGIDIKLEIVEARLGKERLKDVLLEIDSRIRLLENKKL